MRRAALCILIAVLPGSILAQENPQDLPGDVRQSRISAATDQAVRGLLDQIESAPLNGRLSVGQFLFRTGGVEELRRLLDRIAPVGGPRWLDAQTCQVQLEVSGTEVVADLANIAVQHASQSPIDARDLPVVASQLSAMDFAATGTSTAAGVAPMPPPQSAWTPIPPELRRRAVMAADSDAGRVVLASVAPIELTPGHPIAEALGVFSVRRWLIDWLAARPVTAVEYGQTNSGQLEVRVTLAAAPEDFFDALRTAVTAAGLPSPRDPAAWAFVRGEVLQQMAAPVGRASPPPLAATLPLLIPIHPPRWANDMADVSGIGGPAATYLRAARFAEADAMNRLHASVMALPLTPDQTIGQAAANDARLARLVDRAIARAARLYKSQYNPDGTVVVRVSLDLRLLWAAIQDRQ